MDLAGEVSGGAWPPNSPGLVRVSDGLIGGLVRDSGAITGICGEL